MSRMSLRGSWVSGPGSSVGGEDGRKPVPRKASCSWNVPRFVGVRVLICSVTL